MPRMQGAVAALLALGGGAAQAAPETLAVELRAGVGYTDNVNRTSSDERSSATYAVGGRIDYREVTRRLDANVAGDLDYVFYAESGVDDELVGNFDAALRFGIVPETFTWAVENSYGQGRFSLTQPSSPQNREAINFFSTGPELLFRLSPRDYAQLFARYSNAWYEDSEGDNDQFGGGVTLGRNLDPDTRVSLTGNFTRIEYDLDTFPTIDSTQVFASYATQGARSSLNLDLGYRTIDNGDGSDGGPLVRARLNRELSDYATAFVFANYEYNDRAASLSGDLSNPGRPPANNEFGQGGLYEELAGGVGLRYVRSRTTVSGSLSYREQDYVAADANDLERVDLDLGLERKLGPRWSAGIRGSLWRETLTENDDENRELSGSVFARWRSARAFGAQAEWQYWDRSSDFGDAQENRAWLRVTWQPIDRQAQ